MKRLVQSFEVGKEGLVKIDYNPAKKCFEFHYAGGKVVEVYLSPQDLLSGC